MRRRMRNERFPIGSCSLALRQEPGCLSFIIRMQDQSVSHTQLLCVPANVCAHICLCEARARKSPDCLQVPTPTQMSRGKGVLGKSRECVDKCVSLHVCVFSGEWAHVCLWIKEGCKERVIHPEIFFLSPSLSPHLAFCFLIPPLMHTHCFHLLFLPSLPTHAYKHIDCVVSCSQTVAAGGQEPAGWNCINLFPAVGVAANTQHLLHPEVVSGNGQ